MVRASDKEAMLRETNVIGTSRERTLQHKGRELAREIRLRTSGPGRTVNRRELDSVPWRVADGFDELRRRRRQE